MAVYLLHFQAPISPAHTAQHYMGYAEDVARRVDQHRQGSGARFAEVAKERGIDFTVARVWEDGDRTLERRLKSWHNHSQLCPICQRQQTEVK